MGGQVGAKSRKGEGSFFWFTARLEVAPSAAVVTPDSTAPLQGLRALVVDDNSSCRQWLVQSLTELGCVASEAASGTEALNSLAQARAAAAPFQVILLDADLPSSMGEPLVQQVMNDRNRGDARVIIMSPLGSMVCGEGLKQIGVIALLNKPIKQSALLTALLAVRDGGSSFPSQGAMGDTLVFEGLAETIRPGARVLLAEDNLTNQVVACGLLRKFGIEPMVVPNGQAAVQAIQLDSYDLIFMDCQMPIMDGLLATATIRSMEPDGQRTPIVAMTAHALTGDREKCLAAGMDDYLSKPLSVKALAAALQRWLARPGNKGGEIDQEGPSQPLAQTQEKSAQVLDYPDLLSRLMNDRELGHEILTAFIEDMPGKIAELRHAVTTGDASQIKDHGHTVKGAARNVSAQIMQETAWRIEQAGSAGQVEQALPLLPILEAQYQKLEQTIRELLA
jgi:CheY-like chemotaxis protein/HPt (histidine-containing phosphotransfer) domain-containing protein